MPPPVDCCQFPIARFLHLDETTGPSPQHTLAEEREVVETGAEREVAPLSMGEDSSSGVPTQGLPLTGDRIKLVQQNMAEYEAAKFQELERFKAKQSQENQLLKRKKFKTCSGQEGSRREK